MSGHEDDDRDDPEQPDTGPERTGRLSRAGRKDRGDEEREVVRGVEQVEEDETPVGAVEQPRVEDGEPDDLEGEQFEWDEPVEIPRRVEGPLFVAICVGLGKRD